MKTNVTRKFAYGLNLYLNFQKFILAFTLIIGVINFSYATDYYFSSSAGNDNYSASQAQSSSTPWRSLEKLNSIANSLKAGDKILFKSGDVFFGNLNITRGGSAGSPITYTAYGSGAKPVISSMEQVSQWRSVGSGIYESGFTLQAGEEVQVVSLNGQLQEIGRYPNRNEGDEGFLTITGVNGNLSIRGASLPGDFAGGEIVIRKNNWILDRHEISNSSGNTVNFSANPNSSYAPQQGYGYFIQNHVSTLDKLGEWAYSKSSRKLYVYFGAQSPGDFDVKVARGSHLINVSRYIGNLSFSNLNFVGSNGDLIHLENSNNIRVEGCDFKYAGQNAIYAHTTPDIQVRKTSMEYSLSGGVFFQFGTPRAVIEDNSVTHTMPFQGMAQSSDLRGNAIYIAADANNSVIARNQITHTGFNGIHFGGNYTSVKNNFIDNYCLLKQDGGGIYTNSDGLTSMNNTGREIEGNIITRGIGSTGGSIIDYKLVEGIYIDDNAKGIRISGNTIADISGRGMYFHNCSNIEVYDNLFHNIPVQFLASHDMFGDPIRNLRIERNQFSSIFKDEVAFSITSIKNDLNQIGQSNNNYFLDPYGREVIFKSHTVSDGGIGKSSSLGNWKSQLGYEQNSIIPDFDLQPYVVTSSTTLKSSDFSSGLSVVSGVYNVASQLVNGISGGSWQLSSSSGGNGSAFIQIGNINKGDEILVEFDTRSSTPDQTVELILEKTFQQNQEGTIFRFATSREEKKVKILLKSEVNASNESLVFRFPSAVQGLLVDNIEVSKVQTTPVRLEDQIFFQYNYSSKSVTYPLPGKFKNAKGEVFSGAVSVPPYRSVLLALIEEGEEQVIIPPSVEITDPAYNQAFNVGGDIVIKASADSPNGSVQRVEFFVGDILLGASTSQPYQVTLRDAQVGNYLISAKVIDAQNGTAESEKVAIQVIQPEEQGRPAPNQAPTVAISSPGNNQTFNEGDELTIKTQASDPEGRIAKVEFFANNWLIGETAGSPYDLKVENIPSGTYTVIAKIHDEEGLSAESSPITVTVVENTKNKAAGFQIISPSENQVFAQGQSVVIKTNALDLGTNISRVEFFSGNVLLGTTTSSPFEFTVRNAPAGSYAIKAKLIDQNGITSESGIIHVKVDRLALNQAPLIEITSPYQNQALAAGQDVIIKTSAWDLEDQIAWVEFYVGDTQIGSVTSSPYELKVPNVPPGTYALKAKAFDQGGLSAESSRIYVTVNSFSNYRTNSLTLIQPTTKQLFHSTDTIPVVIEGNPGDHAYDSLQVSVNGHFVGITETLELGFSASQLIAGENVLTVKSFKKGGQLDSASVLIDKIETMVDSHSVNSDTQPYSYYIGPNPTSDFLTVYLDKMYLYEDIEVQVLSVTGVILAEISTSTEAGSLTLDVSSYSQGVYFIRIQGKVFPYETKRFIKK
ncbi:Ig-like domain-containing protein [Algoriphagus sp.]|uniref:Ig-like domain-containing protein n=1 Tax=Algoriphagus sp. TaxID=1872435 RepID=UPI003F70B6B8